MAGSMLSARADVDPPRVAKAAATKARTRPADPRCGKREGGMGRGRWRNRYLPGRGGPRREHTVVAPRLRFARELRQAFYSKAGMPVISCPRTRVWMSWV